MNCYYHPDRDVVGVCVTCGRFICVECKVLLGDKIYCNSCVNEMFLERSFTPLQAKEKTAYSKGLRIASGIFGILVFFGAPIGLSSFTKTGMVTEPIVDIISIVIGLFLLLTSFVPSWVSAKTGIKLEKNSVFGLVLAISLIIVFVAIGLGPKIPEGWWHYS